MLAKDQHGASRLLGAHLGPAAGATLVNRFLATWVRQSGLSVAAFGELPEPEERLVDVWLRPEEQVLYRQAEHERAAALARGDY